MLLLSFFVVALIAVAVIAVALLLLLLPLLLLLLQLLLWSEHLNKSPPSLAKASIKVPPSQNCLFGPQHVW